MILPAFKRKEWKLNEEYTLPSGRYYIGDMCYFLRDDIYRDVWGDRYYYEDGIYTSKKGIFAVHDNGVGDGSWEGSDGENYPVDAGNIGIVSVDLGKQEFPRGKFINVETSLKYRVLEKTDHYPHCFQFQWDYRETLSIPSEEYYMDPSDEDEDEDEGYY